MNELRRKNYYTSNATQCSWVYRHNEPLTQDWLANPNITPVISLSKLKVQDKMVEVPCRSISVNIFLFIGLFCLSFFFIRLKVYWKFISRFINAIRGFVLYNIAHLVHRCVSLWFDGLSEHKIMCGISLKLLHHFMLYSRFIFPWWICDVGVFFWRNLKQRESFFSGIIWYFQYYSRI